jgi:hypothetical protein
VRGDSGLEKRREDVMSRKQASKRTRRRTAVTVLGTAGVLSLAGGASAALVGPSEDIPTKDNASRHVITLSEEEVFDVSLGTFYVFDKEDARTHPPGVKLAGHGHGGCGHGGCGHGGCGCGHAGRGCGGCGHGCRGCARGCGGCGGCGYGCGYGGCCIWIGPLRIC